MGFRNSILAGEELVRSAIRSPDFAAGVAGWRIARDGTAEFNDVVVRGELVVGPGPPAGFQLFIGETLGVPTILFTEPGGEEFMIRAAVGGIVMRHVGGASILINTLDEIHLDGLLEPVGWTPDIRNAGGASPSQTIQSAEWSRIGDWVVGTVIVAITGAGAGATAIELDLPVAVDPVTDGAVVGQVVFLDSSAGLFTVGALVAVAGSPTVARILRDGAGASVATQLANGDTYRATLSYRGDF